ncbi:MAG TPA: outer membrane protein assembly factor BamE [Burkholderiaceae bacterium]|nr:outer membrane protein assembly factor BamE [Burkholderiaceae bacterium]HMZ01226.1 outer membrane protein assembly factor BamE [Burkholderiaceae bacterium]HNB44293.1 outer membrane protein assembly factor BamE [Burkholderiaceae bacterium]HNG79894.1 outer membrane protein assembly factor BamE [Burkholderiaceae bacterium]
MLPILVGGCASPSSRSTLADRLAPYRMEVVQGNVVTREMAEQLRPGLSRDQVRSLLGSPLLTDIFHADRWDYVFTIRRQGAAPQQRRVTLYFTNDRLASHEATDLPSEREFVASIDVAKPDPRRSPLELDEAKLRALPLPQPVARGSRVAAAAPENAASGPQRIYPPLEPDAKR